MSFYKYVYDILHTKKVCNYVCKCQLAKYLQSYKNKHVVINIRSDLKQIQGETAPVIHFMLSNMFQFKFNNLARSVFFDFDLK